MTRRAWGLAGLRGAELPALVPVSPSPPVPRGLGVTRRPQPVLTGVWPECSVKVLFTEQLEARPGPRRRPGDQREQRGVTWGDRGPWSGAAPGGRERPQARTASGCSSEGDGAQAGLELARLGAGGEALSWPQVLRGRGLWGGDSGPSSPQPRLCLPGGLRPGSQPVPHRPRRGLLLWMGRRRADR